MSGTARLFNATDTKVDATVAAIDTGDWTMAGWAYANTAGELSQAPLMTIVFGGGARQVIKFNSNNKLVVRQVGATTNADAIASADLPFGKWVCLVGFYRASTAKCYLFQGDEQTPMAEQAYSSQTTLTGARQTGAVSATIGNTGNQLQTWDGAICNVVYDASEWTAAQMEHFRRTGCPSRFETLRGWWPLAGSTKAASEPDRSGHGAAGTVFGTFGFMAGPALATPRIAQARRLVRV